MHFVNWLIKPVSGCYCLALKRLVFATGVSGSSEVGLNFLFSWFGRSFVIVDFVKN